MEMQREDARIRERFRHRREASLPRLEADLRHLASIGKGAEDEAVALRKEIDKIRANEEETDYEFRYTRLLREHEDECRSQYLAQIADWAQQRKFHSLDIHERQRRAAESGVETSLYDGTISVDFVGSHVPPELRAVSPLSLHLNTTLPQLSLVVHEVRWRRNLLEEQPDYHPTTFNAMILNPRLDDDAQLSIVERLDQRTPGAPPPQPPAKRRRPAAPPSAFPHSSATFAAAAPPPPPPGDEAFRVRTSVGETLADGLRTRRWQESVPAGSVRVYLWPQTGSMWRINRDGRQMSKITDFVEQLGRTRTDFQKRLSQKFMIMIGKAPADSLPPLPQVGGGAGAGGPGDRKDFGISKCCGRALITDARTFSEICSACGRSYDGGDYTRNCIGHEHWSPCAHSTYKRINHLNEQLTQLQGKERTDVPKEVVRLVSRQFERERAKKFQVTPRSVREKLKLLGKPYTKYYEHCTQIAWRITGVPPPQLSVAQEEAIRVMFRESQMPYEEMPAHLKRSRPKNFLSYPFFLLKACELKGYREMLPRFQKLKAAQKIFEHDAMWKYICQRNGWRFIPTSIEQGS